MTQEDKDQIQHQIDSLQRRLDDLTNSSTFPRDVETAITERLGSAVASNGTTGAASTQSVSVPSTPTNITVPAQPSGTIAVTIKGTTYNLLYQ